MKAEVRYLSKSGNTKAVAEAIAAAAGCKAETIEMPVNEQTDILFIGGALYWGGIDKALKAYIASLTPSNVKQVAVFSTASIKESAYPQISGDLEKQGLSVLKAEFHCKGKVAKTEETSVLIKKFTEEVMASL